MARVALVIGVSTYGSGLSLLPNAVKDAAAMKAIFESPEIGKFDEVTFLEDPGPLQMQQAIELLFSGRKRDDLVVLFFSGHGLKDSNYRLYFATSLTKKTERGELVRSTAVSASFIHEVMKDSRSRRKVIILDCCFSGAFAEGLSAKDDGSVDIKAQLGGEGCAILASSSSIQYSFEEKDKELSIYTRYLLEGIETGAADLDQNGFISVDELHEYVQRRVHEESPSMDPKIYALEEGYNIQLLEAVVPDPHLRYQRMVEQCAESGTISSVGRIVLDGMRVDLRISPEDADLIETRVLRPHRDYSRKLQDYETALKTALQHGFPIQPHHRVALKQYARTLALRQQDVLAIEAKWEQWLSKRRVASQPILTTTPAATTQQKSPKSPNNSSLTLFNMPSNQSMWILVGAVLTTMIATGGGVYVALSQSQQQTVIPLSKMPDSLVLKGRSIASSLDVDPLSQSDSDRDLSQDAETLADVREITPEDTPIESIEVPEETLMLDEGESLSENEGVEQPLCIIQGNTPQRLRSSPGGSQNLGITVSPGESVTIGSGPEEALGAGGYKNFYEVRKANGTSGWIVEDFIDFQDCT